MGPQHKDEKPVSRLSPGEAAFKRLRERDAVRQEIRKRLSPPKAAASPPRDATPEPPIDIEAALRDQMKSLEAILAQDEPREPEPVAPQGSRSVFAPDPVRQRDYYGLGKAQRKSGQSRLPPPRTDAPRALVEPGARRFDDGEPSAGIMASRMVSVLPHSARERGLDARSLSVAALVGIAVGFLGLTAMGLMNTQESAPVVAMAPAGEPLAGDPSPSEPPVLAARDLADQTTGETVTAVTPEPSPASTKEQARLLTEEPLPLRGAMTPGTLVEPEPSVVATVDSAEPSASDAPAVTATAPVEPPPAVAPASVIASTPAFSSETEPLGGPRILSYAPVDRPENPARRSTARVTESDTGPAEERGPGVSRTTVDVNMRAEPDNDATVVAVVPAGTAVRITGCTFWCTIVADGKRGYVYRKFVGR